MNKLERIYNNDSLQANECSVAMLEHGEALLGLKSCDVIAELELDGMIDYEATEVIFYHLLELLGN